MPIFEYSLFSQIIPAFLLIFVIVYAILQKSKLFGDGVYKIDALVSFAIALLFVIARPARDFVVNLMPFLGVALGVMLVFLVLYGFVGGELKEGKKWMKVTFGILAGIFLVAVVLYVSGWYKNLDSYLYGMFGTGFWSGLILVVIIGGAVIFVMKSGKKD
jgi:hypothetical protein